MSFWPRRPDGGVCYPCHITSPLPFVGTCDKVVPLRHPLLFVRHSVPRGTPLGTEHVRGALRRAYVRAGFPATWTGTHLLRHTAATLMHQRGATLKEVADVLVHLCIDTTMVCTKVNLPALRKVAPPWPDVSA